MKFELIEKEKNTAILKIIEEAKLYNIEELQEQFLDAMSKYKNVIIYAQEVSESDLSFIQLLLAAKKASMASGKMLSMDNISESVASLIERTGVFNIDGESMQQNQYTTILFSEISKE